MHAPRRRHGVPRPRLGVVAAVAAGGFVGGLARYETQLALPAGAGRFPWGILLVNAGGAFVLALLLVLATELPPTTYLRPLLGTGFCGALTTFSSVAVDTDRLAAHGHGATAAGYLLASVATGLAAGLLGVVAGRILTARRHPRSTGKEA
jgi:fluoride exporter